MYSAESCDASIFRCCLTLVLELASGVTHATAQFANVQSRGMADVYFRQSLRGAAQMSTGRVHASARAVIVNLQ